MVCDSKEPSLLRERNVLRKKTEINLGFREWFPDEMKSALSLEFSVGILIAKRKSGRTEHVKS